VSRFLTHSVVLVLVLVLLVVIFLLHSPNLKLVSINFHFI